MILDPSESNKWFIWYGNPDNKTAQVAIWATDYTNYALVYSCNDDSNEEFIWILSRKKTIGQEIVTKLKKALSNVCQMII